MDLNIYDDPLARTMHTKDIVKQLRIDIILGKYKRGTRLIETAIAEQLGTSRAPIRTALQMLSQEGLVLSLPNGGTEVVGFLVEDIIDLFDLRLLLEKKALELVLVSTSFNYRPIFDIMEKIEEMHNKSDKMKVTDSEMAILDVQFHRSLIYMLNNKPLYAAWNTMANVFHAILEISNATYTDFEAFYESHRRLADLVIQKKPECIDNLTSHITKCKHIIVSEMEKVYASQEE